MHAVVINRNGGPEVLEPREWPEPVAGEGQLDLNYVPFEDLIDAETLVTVVRYVEPGSDFHRLARFLETYVNE